MQGPVTTSSARLSPHTELSRLSHPAGAGSGNLPVRPSGGQTSARVDFGPVFRAANQAPATRRYDIQPGDTLSAIAHRRLQELGLPSNASDVSRAVVQLASANGISNPDRIFAGDKLDLRVLDPSGTRAAGSAVPMMPTQVAARALPQASQPISTAVRPFVSAPGQAVFPQLQKTLDRAVERGYVEPHDRQAVQDRIVELGRKFRFSPDDFATVALMESDGLNPKATNGRCHGILQFCEGPGRGAASVGMQGRAADIQQQPVLSQLDLVERYFEDTRLGEKGPVSLVDLYLTVLTPAARVEQRPNAALDIAGQQAKALHVSGDRSQPITRQSILSGLISHAQQRLDALIHPKRAAEIQASRGVSPARGEVSAVLGEGLPAGAAGAKRELEARDRIGRQG